VAQDFADKEYYLVDSLVLEDLSEGDRELLNNSLKKFHLAKDDTSKINALTGICENMIHESWEKYNLWVYEFAKTKLTTRPSSKIKKKLLTVLSFALNNIGYVYKNQGNHPKALEYYYKSLKIQEETVNKPDIASSLNNIGYVFDDQGDIPKALEYYHKSLKIYEEINDKKGVANVLSNIGYTFEGQGDYPKALEYYFKTLKIREEIGDKSGMAYSLNNIGGVYDDQKNYSKALEYHYESLKIEKEIGDKKGIAISLNNIGVIYTNQANNIIALEFYKKSLKIREEIGDKSGMAYSLINIGNIELQKGGESELIAAKERFQKAFDIAQEIGYPSIISKTSGYLSELYKKQGKGIKALDMYKLHVQMKDSINNEATQKASIRQQTKYEFEKAQIVKENEAKEQTRVLAEATGRRNNLQYNLIFLGILVLFVAILMLGFIRVSPNVAEGLIFFAFLILFEFVLVFSEPYLEQYTNGEPMYNLLANSVLALLIFPVHAILEKLLKKRIVK
jgi:tetratricopeptide (TPR) repeat protein